MFPYLIILVFTYYFAGHIDRLKQTDPQKANRQKWWLIAVLTAFVGLRYAVGADYFAYIHDYYKWNSTLSFGAILVSKEPLIRLLAKLCHTIYVPKYVPIHFFLVMAFIFVSTCVCTIYKYSSDFSLSVVLFILCGPYLDSCNATRQCIAAGIFFANYENIRSQRLLKFLLLTFVAYLFHSSAITLLPLFFVFTPNLSKEKQILWLLCTALLLFVSFNTMMEYTETILNKELGANVTYFNTRVNFLRVLVFLAPCLFLVLQKQLLKVSLPPYAVFILFNALRAVVTVRSAYLMRICIYTNIFLCLALPEALRKVPLSKESTDMLLAFLLVFYFIFWTYGLLNSGGLYPYQCVLFS